LISINHISAWLKPVQRRQKNTVFRLREIENYKSWFMQFDSFTKAARTELAEALDACSNQPRIGIVPFARQPVQKHRLDKFEESLGDQIYPEWKLFPPVIERAGCLSAQALHEAAQDVDFVLPLPVDGVLRPQALAMFVLVLSAKQDAEILYADEDHLRNGLRCTPYFKTDWDPFLILGCNYTGAPVLFKSELLKRLELKDLSSRTVDNFLHAVMLRASGATAAEKILHIPSILFHRSAESDWSASEASSSISERDGLLPTMMIQSDLRITHGNRVRVAIPEPAPFVSILIPTRDHSDILKRCVDGLSNETDYAPFEIILIDNGTTEAAALEMFEAWEQRPDIKIIHDDRPFNYSQLNNEGARIAKGGIFVFLNNDMEILDPGWLKELVSLASLPSVGIVGAKLLYPDFRVQHAGITFGPDDAVLHEMQLAARTDPGLHGELSMIRSVSAVTGACLAMRSELYRQVGGFDEEFRVAFNDVDLCRRVADLGYSILWTPFAELIHHECLSRGPLVDSLALDRELSEQMRFWSRHNAFYAKQDPFHNPQIEFRGKTVDFARPPRPHQFRDMARGKTLKPFAY